MKPAALTIIGFFLSFAAWAQNGAAYKNFAYINLDTLQQACPARSAPAHKDKLECLGFSYSVSSPRDVESGLAQGKRASVQMGVKPLMEPIAQKIVELIKSGQTSFAQRAWRDYIKRMARVRKPVNLNDEMSWILREAYYKDDPELDFHLKEYAATAEAQGLAADRIAENQRLLGNCLQIPNCPAQSIQKSLAQARSILDQTTQSNEMEMIELQSVIASRAELIQLISNMIKAMDDTTRAILGNMEGGCETEPCRAPQSLTISNLQYYQA